MQSSFGTRLDNLQNRVLVKNSHKYVFKKMAAFKQDSSWCQRYMSVAASKLSNPRLTTKLPFSLNKKSKWNSFESLDTDLKKTKYSQKQSFSCLPSSNRKLKVLAINSNPEPADYSEVRRFQTIENDELIRASKDSFKLVMRAKKKHSVKLKSIQNHESGNKCRFKKRDDFNLQPWNVEDQDQEELKQNRFLS